MKKLLLGTLMMSLCLVAHATTYKCVAGGKVRYTNQAQSAAEHCVEVFVRKLPTANTAKAEASATEGGASKDAVSKPGETKPNKEKTLADKALEDKLKKAEADEADKKSKEREAQQKAKQQNCQTAKLNVNTLKVGRVTRLDEKGEKYFLDAAAIAKELEQATKEVEKWCNEP